MTGIIEKSPLKDLTPWSTITLRFYLRIHPSTPPDRYNPEIVTSSPKVYTKFFLEKNDKQHDHHGWERTRRWASTSTRSWKKQPKKPEFGCFPSRLFSAAFGCWHWQFRKKWDTEDDKKTRDKKDNKKNGGKKLRLSG